MNLDCVGLLNHVKRIGGIAEQNQLLMFVFQLVLEYGTDSLLDGYGLSGMRGGGLAKVRRGYGDAVGVDDSVGLWDSEEGFLSLSR